MKKAILAAALVSANAAAYDLPELPDMTRALDYLSAPKIRQLASSAVSKSSNCDSRYVKAVGAEIHVNNGASDDGVSIQCAIDMAKSTGARLVKLTTDGRYALQRRVEVFGWTGEIRGKSMDHTVVSLHDDSDGGPGIEISGSNVKIARMELNGDFAIGVIPAEDKRNRCQNSTAFVNVDRVRIYGRDGILVASTTSPCQANLLGQLTVNRSEIYGTDEDGIGVLAMGVAGGYEVNLTYNRWQRSTRGRQAHYVSGNSSLVANISGNTFEHADYSVSDLHSADGNKTTYNITGNYFEPSGQPSNIVSFESRAKTPTNSFVGGNTIGYIYSEGNRANNLTVTGNRWNTDSAYWSIRSYGPTTTVSGNTNFGGMVLQNSNGSTVNQPGSPLSESGNTNLLRN